MGRYMGRNRWVALEQAMSSPEGILFIFHFSHPPIFLVPPNSHHHPRTRSRGWWCCYALGWLLRFESIAFPSDASNYARFRNLTTHSPFHRLFLITQFRWTFEIQCGGVSASYLPEFLGACPHRVWCQDFESFKISFFGSSAAHPIQAKVDDDRWLIITLFFNPQEAISSHPTDSKKGVSRVSIKKYVYTCRIKLPKC